MNTLKIFSLVVLSATFGLAHFSALADEYGEQVPGSANQHATSAVLDSDLEQDRFAVVKPVNLGKNKSANPRLNINWVEDISIELTDAELISRTRI